MSDDDELDAAVVARIGVIKHLVDKVSAPAELILGIMFREVVDSALSTEVMIVLWVEEGMELLMLHVMVLVVVVTPLI